MRTINVGTLRGLVLVLILWPATTIADAVPPPPRDCPPGYTPATGHGGPYCRPPLPTDCPPNHLPKVNGRHAYCEPPPAEPCPVGSYWTSSSATSTSCRGGGRCDSGVCGAGYTCRESSLCVTEVQLFRAGSYEVVSGVCETDADCGGENEQCVTAQRCDPDVKRGAEEKPSTPRP